MSGHQSGSVVLTESEKFALSASVDTALMTSRLKPERDVKIQLTVATVVTARLAAQAGRVAEVVEKVLREAGLKPIITAALAAQVAAELEADHG